MSTNKNDPKHIAFILDGNRRWAKKHLVSGHNKGIEVAKENVLSLIELGIPIATYYIFSQDNNKRSLDEIKLLKSLFHSFFENNLSFIKDNKIRVNILGDLKSFDESLYLKVQDIENQEPDNCKITLNLAINYSAKEEIVRATKSIMLNNIAIDDITTDVFAKHLYTKGMQDPDIIVRTGGEKRLSDFLLWQLSYSEIFFKDMLWPDFTKEHLIQILQEYKTRERRYGK